MIDLARLIERVESIDSHDGEGTTREERHWMREYADLARTVLAMYGHNP